MKICMLTSSFLPTIGGMQMQAKWLAEGIAEQGEEVYLLTPNDTTYYIDQKENGFPKNINLNFKDISPINLKGHVANIFKLRKAISKINPDIIQAFSPLPDGLYVILTRCHKKIPLIVRSHGEDIVKIKEINYGYRLNPIYSNIIKFVLKRCDRHVCNSDATIRYALEAGSSKEKIRKIHNCIPPPRELKEREIEKIREKYKTFSDGKIILTLSGMRTLKGLDYLIKAMPEVLKEHPSTHLILTSKGEEYEKYLRNLIKKLGIERGVTFAGFVAGDEKHALLKISDIFCIPSVYDSFPTAILEAMQYGTAIVASNVGGIPEAIENGKTGLLTPPKNPSELSMAINLLVSDDKMRERIGIEAKETVKEFSIQNIAKEYINLYGQAINV